MNADLVLALVTFFFIITIVVIISMFVSLSKQGDERRKMIVEKASAKTFTVTILYLLFCIAENMYKVVSRTDLSPEGLNPFITLTVIAMIYAVILVHHKKKYGD